MKFQNTGASAVTPSAATPGAIIPGAVTSDANAPNAAASGAPDRAESEETQPPPIKRGRGRPRKQPNAQLDQPDLAVFLLDEIDSPAPSPRTPYAESRKEINGLLNKGVLDVIALTDVPPGVRLFNSRFVDEIKNPGTSAAFEKSRLVVQAFNDQGKGTVMTQSPTIQRMSQRLILTLAAITGHGLHLRDISQAYVQSATPLAREFYIRPPVELGLGPDHVLKVIKPLYGVPEAGAHWYNTYHNHHTKQLAMHQSTYDPCLLHTDVTSGGKGFGVVGLQTDDTLILADEHFAEAEEIELHRAKLLVKPREQLIIITSIKFNGGYLKQTDINSILFNQERLCQSLRTVKLQPTDLVNTRGTVKKLATPKDQYIAQRARGAYIASLSQPEASFDLSFAAQTINPKEKDARALNRRLQWQIDNYTRGLQFVQLNRESLKLVTFTDGSFANNSDLTSQIGYVICLTDVTGKANIIH